MGTLEKKKEKRKSLKRKVCTHEMARSTQKNEILLRLYQCDEDYSILIQAFYVSLYVHRIKTRTCATVKMNEHTRCCVIATHGINSKNINSGDGGGGDRIAFV